MKIFRFISLLIFCKYGATAENILFFHPVSTYSHRISVWPLVTKLVEKGHQITFISPYLSKTPLPNVTDIVPEPTSSFVQKYIHGDLDISKRVDGTMALLQDTAPMVGSITCEMLFESAEIQNWLEKDPHFDLVVVDWFVSECGLGLAYKFKAKTMFYAAAVMIPGIYEMFGIVPDTNAVPEFDYHFSTPMTFWERLINTLQPLVWRYKMSGYYDKITDILRKKLNVSDMPHIGELAKNTSLVLWSEEVLDGYPSPITPNFVRVGGMHCQEKANPLPKDLAKFIDQGSRGFIYISLGSGVTPSNLPSHYQDIFFKTISHFSNIQFVWKWSGSTRSDKLQNLHIGDWFPQQDILGHPKLLTFITQAGKPSVQEAICNSVPIIAMPVMCDQDANAKKIELQNASITLDIASLTEANFQAAIQEMISNKKYKNAMQKLSKKFLDRPMKPADTALWWTEYVLRSEDTSHLKSLSINSTWYHRRLLDVWAFIILVVAVSTAIIVYFTTVIIKVCLVRRKLKKE